MFDNILRIIWVIIIAFVIGFVFYFRKQLKSILHALSDMDLLKAGPLEFKRRQQELKTILSVQSDEKSDAQSESEKTPEQTILSLKEQLLVTSSLAYFFAAFTDVAESRQIKDLKDIRDDIYKDLISTCPDSYAIAYSGKIDSFLKNS